MNENQNISTINQIPYHNTNSSNENVQKLIKEIEQKKILVASVMKNMQNMNKSINKITNHPILDAKQIPTFNQVNSDSDFLSNSNNFFESDHKKHNEKLNSIATQVYKIQKESEDYKKLFKNMIEMEQYFQKSLTDLNNTFESLKLKAFKFGVIDSDNLNYNTLYTKNQFQQNSYNTNEIENRSKMTNRFKNKVERIVFKNRVDNNNKSNNKN